jgi:hypothetical protein
MITEKPLRQTAGSVCRSLDERLMLLHPFLVAPPGSVAVVAFSTNSMFTLCPTGESFALHVRLTLIAPVLAKTIRPSYRTELHNSGPDEEEWLQEHIPPERYR